MSQEIRILLSAYACEPDKGSEPGVGWKWASGLASRVDLHVLTRESNREVIQRAVEASPVASPLRTVQFYFHDLPRIVLWLKEKRILPTIGYYFIWQWAVSRRFRSLADSVDVVHHLTFCTLLCPGFWRLKKAAFVVGPVGAPLVNKHYFELFGDRATAQRIRGWVMNRFLRLPWLRRLLHSAAAVVPANTETKQLLERHGIAACEVMLDTGVTNTQPSKLRELIQTEDSVCRFIYAGRLERRKALELALRAFSLAYIEGCKNWSFTVLGDGPDRGRLRQLADELEISDQLRFVDPVPQAEVLHYFHQSDVFVFTSVRDTSGGVNLEAMAAGLPILCLAHQGVGDITDDSCALRIKPGPVSETIRSLADGIKTMIDEPARRAQMGVAAQQRAACNFSWDEKFNGMLKIYEMVARS